MKRLTDQLLGDIGSVEVSGIDKVDAELRQALQRADGLRPVGRLTPNAGTGDAHGAESEAVDLDLASNLERARLPGIKFDHFGTPLPLAQM